MSKNAWSPGRMIRSVKLWGCGLHRSPGDRVDGLDLVRAELVEALVGHGDDLVLPDAGLERLGDVLVDPVDHGGCLVEQQDLVEGLDAARVQHRLLGIHHTQALAFHLEEERRLDDVDADRHVRHAGLDEEGLDLLDRRLHQADRGSDRAAEAEEARAVVVLRRPLRVELVVLDRGPEVPEHRLLAAGQERVPDHLVAEGAADPGLGGVADVVEVEEQEGAALAGLERRLGPAEPVGAEPVEVDPGLVVDTHVAGCRDGAAAEVEARDLDPGCLLGTDDAHCGLSPSWGHEAGAGRGNPVPGLVRGGGMAHSRGVSVWCAGAITSWG